MLLLFQLRKLLPGFLVIGLEPDGFFEFSQGIVIFCHLEIELSQLEMQIRKIRMTRQIITMHLNESIHLGEIAAQVLKAV